jgi:acyl-CoA synthetase (AMP-forming)/AMP-acid ligase II
VQDLAEWIPDLCPTWLWGNPTFFQAVLDKLRSRAGMKLTHSLRFVVSGTAHLPPTLREELEATLGVPVLQSYGMSEAGILAADHPCFPDIRISRGRRPVSNLARNNRVEPFPADFGAKHPFVIGIV